MLNKGEQCIIIKVRVSFIGSWLAGECKTLHVCNAVHFFPLCNITVININEVAEVTSCKDTVLYLLC